MLMELGFDFGNTSDYYWCPRGDMVVEFKRGGQVASVLLLYDVKKSSRILTLGEQAERYYYISVDAAASGAILTCGYLGEVSGSKLSLFKQDCTEPSTTHVEERRCIVSLSGCVAVSSSYVMMYDMEGRGGKIEKIYETEAAVGQDAKVLSLGDQTALLIDSHLAVFDGRTTKICKQPSRNGRFGRSVIAGSRVFVTVNDVAGYDYTGQTLVFEPVRSPLAQHVFTVQLNAAQMNKGVITDIFAWHPAAGAMVVVVAGWDNTVFLFEIVVVNPHTLHGVTLTTVKSAEWMQFFPAHVCGMPVIMTITGTCGKVRMFSI